MSCIKECRNPWPLIAVEPILFLYSVARDMTSVIEQEWYMRKSCLLDHNLSKSICENLKEYPELYMKVQVRFSNSFYLQSERNFIFYWRDFDSFSKFFMIFLNTIPDNREPLSSFKWNYFFSFFYHHFHIHGLLVRSTRSKASIAHWFVRAIGPKFGNVIEHLFRYVSIPYAGNEYSA